MASAGTDCPCPVGHIRMTPARLTTVRLKPPASITVRRPPRTLLGIWSSTWSSPVPPTLWLKELGAQGRLVFCGLHSPRCLPAPTASHLTWALGERRCTQLTPQRAALPSRWAGEQGLRTEGPDTPTLLCSKQAADPPPSASSHTEPGAPEAYRPHVPLGPLPPQASPGFPRFQEDQPC